MVIRTMNSGRIEKAKIDRAIRITATGGAIQRNGTLAIKSTMLEMIKPENQRWLFLKITEKTNSHI